MTYRTRFAPSPTGPLHLGHAYSALVGAARAHQAEGEFLVRIEDLDQTRARPHWEALIHEDLAWLGLQYPQPALRQSERGAAYATALARLWDAGLLYPCTCTRRDIDAASAPQEGVPSHGPDGPIYPGTCRRPVSGPMPMAGTLRLNMREAVEAVDTLTFLETGDAAATGPQTVGAVQMISHIGDVILRRRDMGAAYHLAVVVDDAAQGITEVVRGADLFPATPIHVLLQHLLQLPTPAYHHHRLIRDDAGKRLAKRDDARALSTLRDEGWSPADIRCAVGL